MKIIMNDSKKLAWQPPPSQDGPVTYFTQGESVFTENNATIAAGPITSCTVTVAR